MNKANHISSIKYSMNPIENARIRNIDRKHQVATEKNPSLLSQECKGILILLGFFFCLFMGCFFLNRESSVSKQVRGIDHKHVSRWAHL